MELSFGEKIKTARKLKGMTQKQLADKIDAKHNSVSDWENNKNKPDPDTIELLCEILDIAPNYLLAVGAGDFSPFEKLVIKKYRDLDNHGKEMVDFTLEKEWERSTANKKTVHNIVKMPEPDYLISNAVHARTDIELSEGVDTSENDI